MRTLHLDYVQSYRPFPTLGIFLLVCAIAVGFQTARQHDHSTLILADWEAKEGQVERLARQYDVRPDGKRQNSEQLSREVLRANEVLRRISLPWGELFGAVESVAPKDVALLAMEPDADSHVLKIAGEARNASAMLCYIRNLESMDMFRTVTLQSHQVQQRDPQRPIRFSIIAAWRDRP